MVNANDFFGLTDNERIQNAVDNRGSDGIVLIPPRKSESEPERTVWLLDAAVLLPENTTVILQNCVLKLSDRCRDNFFRTANCGMGIEFPERIRNVHICGEGLCILEGADHPRAAGDSSKLLHAPCPHLPEDICRVADWIPEERRQAGSLEFWDIHNHSYGTDAGVEGESQYGDWRGIGILFANTEDFSISGLRIVKPHGWSISLEECAHGRVERIDFDSCMYKDIDGMRMNMENQDGVDIRNGCHHIIVSDITGCTGDNVIAFTAIADSTYRSGGSLKSTQVMHNDWSRREKDIHDIIIRNVIAYSYLCYTVRLLPAYTSIYNVVIDGVIDTSPSCDTGSGTILLGANDASYGKNAEDSLRHITVSNIVCNSKTAILLAGYITDSVITNVVNKNPDCPVIFKVRENGLKNTVISNTVSPLSRPETASHSIRLSELAE